MRIDYDKICKLIEKGMMYIPLEKHDEWTRYVIYCVFDGLVEADIVVRAMSLIEEGVVSSIVLDEIYATRLSISTCQDILYKILIFYKNGPSFWRDIYKDYMTDGLNQLIESVELNSDLNDKKLVFY